MGFLFWAGGTVLLSLFLKFSTLTDSTVMSASQFAHFVTRPSAPRRLVGRRRSPVPYFTRILRFICRIGRGIDLAL